MPLIEFTQYYRPHGQAAPITIDRPTEVATRYEALKKIGVKFEAEVLMTGTVSFEAFIMDPDTKDPVYFATEITPNGPPVLDAVDKLVNNAYARAMEGNMICQTPNS